MSEIQKQLGRLKADLAKLIDEHEKLLGKIQACEKELRDVKGELQSSIAEVF